MTTFIQAIIYPNTKNTVHSSQSVRSPAVLDLPTSRAQSFFFGSAKNQKKPHRPTTRTGNEKFRTFEVVYSGVNIKNTSMQGPKAYTLDTCDCWS